MRGALLFMLFLFAVYHVADCGVRRKRQLPQIPQLPGPIANGDIITSIFQIPIQTLGAVRDLLHSTRGRFQAVGQAYQALMAAHPNHRPNPHFAFDSYNSNPQQQSYNTNRPQQQNYNSYRPQQQNYNNYRPQQQNYNNYRPQHQSYNSYRPQQQSYNYNRRRVYNSKALVQPRDNSISSENDQSSPQS